MGKFILAGLITAILALAAIWAFDPSYRQQRADQAFYAAENARRDAVVQATQDTLNLGRAQLQATQDAIDAHNDAQRSQQLAPIVTSGYIFLGVVAGLGVLAGGMFCLLFLGRRLLLVRPDAQNVLPMPLVGFAGLADAARASLGAFHLGRIEQARHQPGQTPHSINYAPNFTRSITAESTRFPDGSSLDAAPLLGTGVPTFAQLLDQGRIGRGQPLLLGVDEEGGEVAGSWLDLYSTIVSGLPGSGKTTSQRFLACQTALQGARFVVVDPHAGAADDSLAATLQPLASAFLCAPASDDKAILSAVQLVADIGERRVKGKDTSTWPVILWLDETTKLLSRSTVAGPLATLLEGIAQEYRKKNVFACASGQIWSASRTGDDSALRDSFASVLCHRMKRSQARLLIPTEEAQTVERLGTGQAVLWRTSGETSVISVPNTTAHDVVRVAGLLTDTAPTIERIQPTSNGLLGTLLNSPVDVPGTPDGRQLDASDEVASTAPQSAIALQADAARIIAEFRAGAEVKDIIRTLRPNVNSGSREYRDLRAQVEATIRQHYVGGES